MKILTLLIFTITFLAGASFAQAPANPGKPAVERAARQRRPDLFRALGLTEIQKQELERLNTERRPQVAEAQKQLAAAKRELDSAIYADTVDEAAVESKLKAYQDAQAEIARIRFTNELAIRKLLTPEQLLKFREMRQNFGEGRREFRRDRRIRNRRLRGAPAVKAAPQPPSQ